jgi:hypothetical protein
MESPDVPSRDARITDAEHRRILDLVARMERGEDVPTISGEQHKAEISAKLRHLNTTT